MHLYIAYKNYSSWSLRPWLAMQVNGIEFTETILPFYHDQQLEQLSERYNIPAQVPVLVDNGLVIWDSMAQMEYLAEKYPHHKLWPKDTALRSLARSACAEMHSGFLALREQCPMNCRSQKSLSTSQRTLIQADLDRLAALWEHFAQAQSPKGDFLCGDFGIVDAMYAPVMWRVKGYNLSVSASFEQWSQAMQTLPAMQEWLSAAQQESWVIEAYESAGAS